MIFYEPNVHCYILSFRCVAQRVRLVILIITFDVHYFYQKCFSSKLFRSQRATGKTRRATEESSLCSLRFLCGQKILRMKNATNL